MLERVVEAVCFMVGARVGFFRGDIRGLVDDIRELQPTVVPVVPRVLNRLYDRVIGEVNKSRLKRALFDVAVAFKKRELDKFVCSLTSIHSYITMTLDCDRCHRGDEVVRSNIASYSGFWGYHLLSNPVFYQISVRPPTDPAITQLKAGN
jgi:long-subunit acyl-CoA synthetase (AMP-forming)